MPYIHTYIVLVLFLFACQQEQNLYAQSGKANSSPIRETSPIPWPEENVMPYTSAQLDSIAQAEHEEDSLQLVLSEKANKFIWCLQLNDYKAARKLLHPEGLYYYTLGRIPAAEFSRETLQESTGKLDGAYAYGENPDSAVSGMHWLDALRYNYTDQKHDWHKSYGSTAYGFTGNWSSDHIIAPLDSELAEATVNIRVAYIEHIDPDIGYRNLLMIEFFEDGPGNWKIYALGNLEWTP